MTERDDRWMAYCERCHQPFAVDDMKMLDGKLLCRTCWDRYGRSNR